jgi:hypothetical protein
LLRGFGLKVGKISKGNYEKRIRELVSKRSVEPTLRGAVMV